MIFLILFLTSGPKMEQNKIYGEILKLKYIHTHLCWLCYYNKSSSNVEETIIEDFEFLDLIKNKWGKEILSDQTFEHLACFRQEWLQYKKGVNYAGDTVFMFFDNKWFDIIKNYLIPLLESMEKDFSLNKIKYTSYRNSIDLDTRPSTDDILERGRTLYKLLLKNKVIKKKVYELDELHNLRIDNFKVSIPGSDPNL